MALNPTHIQPQPEMPLQSELNSESDNSSFVPPNQMYVIELVLPSGEQTLIKCTFASFRIGSDPNLELVLSGAGIEPVHMQVTFTAERVIVHNHSMQSIGYSRAGVYLNGQVYGEGQPRMGFKSGLFSLPFGKKERKRRRPIIGNLSTKKEHLNLIIAPDSPQPWLVGSTLIFCGHLMTLYHTPQFSGHSTNASLFEVVEGQILPNIELRNRRFAGLYMRQIFGAWWIFALLFLSGGFFSFTTLRYFIPWLRQLQWFMY